MECYSRSQHGQSKWSLIISSIKTHTCAYANNYNKPHKVIEMFIGEIF